MVQVSHHGHVDLCWVAQSTANGWLMDSQARQSWDDIVGIRRLALANISPVFRVFFLFFNSVNVWLMDSQARQSWDGIVGIRRLVLAHLSSVFRVFFLFFNSVNGWLMDSQARQSWDGIVGIRRLVLAHLSPVFRVFSLFFNFLLDLGLDFLLQRDRQLAWCRAIDATIPAGGAKR